MTGPPICIATSRFSNSGGRDYNEDFLDDCKALGAVHLFILADGAGGQGGGDVAAQTAVAAATAEFRELPLFTPDTLQRCIAKADAAVRDKQTQGGHLSHMACTGVALLISYQRSQALLTNLGDSRAYVFRGDQIIAQSYDHSLVQRFIDAGLYPLDKLRQHPKRNVLYASLGANPEGVLPYLSETPVDLQPGDGVLLCSDGVWELLDETLLTQLHASSDNVERWSEQLFSAVQQAMPAGHDNFSAYLLRCLPANTSEDDTLPPGTPAISQLVAYS
jgi:PPM family protein phosphatase